MPADYSSFKPTFGDTANYPALINALIDAIQTDMNLKLDTADLTYKSIRAITTNATIGMNPVSGKDDYTIEIDATIADVTATLPAAATNSGRLLVFRRLDQSAYRAIIDTVHELFALNEYVVLQSNGTAWVRIG